MPRQANKISAKDKPQQEEHKEQQGNNQSRIFYNNANKKQDKSTEGKNISLTRQSQALVDAINNRLRAFECGQWTYNQKSGCITFPTMTKTHQLNKETISKLLSNLIDKKFFTNKNNFDLVISQNRHSSIILNLDALVRHQELPQLVDSDSAFDSDSWEEDSEADNEIADSPIPVQGLG